jgi:serine phosphatase RsbU (regulator of sigma subunit)
MGALRNVSRALLAEGRSPAEVIASLDRFATTMPAAECATVVCAVVDLAAQTITYSNAGHPPPLLVRDDSVVWLSEALAAPLAVDEPPRQDVRVDVEPGDLLVLYTDGLVERRGETLDDGLERLARVAVASQTEAVQVVADRLIEEMVGETARDDVALVVKRIH